jgi:hypothetical protein
MIVDELLHSVIPAYTLIYWLIYSEEKNLKIPSVLIWLLYPIVYIVYILIRGSISGFYPYFFLNISETGIGHTLFNILLLLSLSAFIILTLTFIGKKTKERKISL